MFPFINRTNSKCDCHLACFEYRLSFLNLLIDLILANVRFVKPSIKLLFIFFRRAKALDDNIVTASLLQTHEIGQHLDTQNGTAYLDNFVHKLIVKCNSEVSSWSSNLRLFNSWKPIRKYERAIKEIGQISRISVNLFDSNSIFWYRRKKVKQYMSTLATF